MGENRKEKIWPFPYLVDAECFTGFGNKRKGVKGGGRENAGTERMERTGAKGEVEKRRDCKNNLEKRIEGAVVRLSDSMPGLSGDYPSATTNIPIPFWTRLLLLLLSLSLVALLYNCLCPGHHLGI